jgi:hypothetical protein
VPVLQSVDMIAMCFFSSPHDMFWFFPSLLRGQAASAAYNVACLIAVHESRPCPPVLIFRLSSLTAELRPIGDSWHRTVYKHVNWGFPCYGDQMVDFSEYPQGMKSH